MKEREIEPGSFLVQPTKRNCYRVAVRVEVRVAVRIKGEGKVESASRKPGGGGGGTSTPGAGAGSTIKTVFFFIANAEVVFSPRQK